MKRRTLAERGGLDFSPETGCHCPQIYFDPILAARVKTLPSVTIRYDTRLDAFSQDQDHVSARLTDMRRNVSETVTARYLVGCDGPAGVVREALGIGLGGLGVVANSVNIFFRSRQLASLPDKGRARISRLWAAGGPLSALAPLAPHDPSPPP